MLVLTRKPKEVIQIGENITVTIVRIKGQTVRVGINAPRDVRVIRGELTAFDDADKPTERAVNLELSNPPNAPLDQSRPCAPRLPKTDRFQNERPGQTAFGMLAARERMRRTRQGS